MQLKCFYGTEGVDGVTLVRLMLNLIAYVNIKVYTKKILQDIHLGKKQLYRIVLMCLSK